MKKLLCACLLALPLTACQESPTDSSVTVTTVSHTPVKRQSIGNCWLYAHATWLESMIKASDGQVVNISETYWTYWDLYNKLLEKRPIPEDELNTGGSWSRSTQILKSYGWVSEEAFIAKESNAQMSEAQKCAQDYIMREGKDGGRLADLEKRTPELVREELHKAFSCDGRFEFDIDAAYEQRNTVEKTKLRDPHTGIERSLKDWLGRWRMSSISTDSWGAYEGKKMFSEKDIAAFKKVEQRIKKALNDHYPVVVSFFVSFNAPDPDGLFNLQTLGEKGSLGDTGGHLLVLHDYVVDDVEEFGQLGEGDLEPELKDLALTGNMRYVVAKNSWGEDRTDRPWLKNGYTRLSWDYLRARYFDENSETFRTFMSGVVLPEGY